MNRRKGTVMRHIQIALGLITCLLVTPLMASGEDATVEITHQAVSPTQLSIQKGETVTFVNKVAMPGGHSVVADDNSFASPPLEKDQTWDHTFEEAGTFAYHLDEHPNTKGVIDVK